MMKVSHFSVWAADKVTKRGVPQLVDAVAAGKVSVSAASRIASTSTSNRCWPLLRRLGRACGRPSRRGYARTSRMMDPGVTYADMTGLRLRRAESLSENERENTIGLNSLTTRS